MFKFRYLAVSMTCFLKLWKKKKSLNSISMLLCQALFKITCLEVSGTTFVIKDK